MTGPREPLRPPWARRPPRPRAAARRPRAGRAALRGRGQTPTIRFLGEVAAHLVGAGGKRLRPTLTLCAAYAATGGGAPGRPTTRSPARVAVELVHLGSLYHDDVIDEAETRRGVPSVNARWSNIVAILAGDYLLAQASSLAASLGADVAGAARRDDRRAVPRPGARAAAPLRRRPHRGGLLLRDRGQDRGAVRDRVPHRRHGERASPTPRSTRSRRFGHHLGMCFQIVDDVLDVTAHRSRARQAGGQRPARGRLHAAGDLRAARVDRSCATCSGGPLDPEQLEPRSARARPLATVDAVELALGVARDHAVKASDALDGADGARSRRVPHARTPRRRPRPPRELSQGSLPACR